MKKRVILMFIVVVIATLSIQFSFNLDTDFVSYTVNPKKQNVGMYWKNEQNLNFGSLQNLKLWLNKNNKELLFGMNGGMYKKDKSPQGLYIENKIKKAVIDTSSGNGNFYLKPNGIFFLTTNNEAHICKTTNYVENSKVKFATQSGPVLVIDGQIHKAFNENSENLNIRNGVGILPNNEILFVMSKKEVNFYEFAAYFQKKGCKNALYLDGFVSKTYCPEQKWTQIDGDFGVIIGVTKNK